MKELLIRSIELIGENYELYILLPLFILCVECLLIIRNHIRSEGYLKDFLYYYFPPIVLIDHKYVEIKERVYLKMAVISYFEMLAKFTGWFLILNLPSTERLLINQHQILRQDVYMLLMNGFAISIFHHTISLLTTHSWIEALDLAIREYLSRIFMITAIAYQINVLIVISLGIIIYQEFYINVTSYITYKLSDDPEDIKQIECHGFSEEKE